MAVLLSSKAHISLGRDFRGTVVNDECGTVGVVIPNNVFTNQFANLIRVKEDKIGDVSKHRLNPGDILITGRHKFRAVVVEESWCSGYKDIVANAGLFVVRLHGKYVKYPEYIASVLNCIVCTDKFKEAMLARKKSRVVNLLRSDIENFCIPSIDNPSNFIAKVQKTLKYYDEEITTLEKEQERLRQKLIELRNGEEQELLASFNKIYKE